MKVCKLVHINDGNEVQLRNGGMLFVETYPTTEEIINMYLEKGFVVKQIMQEVTPALSRPGDYTFYKGGVLVYFEIEVDSIEEADDSDIRAYIEGLETQYDRENENSGGFDESCFVTVDEDEFYYDDDFEFQIDENEE